MQKIEDHSAIVLPLVLSQYQRASRLLGLVRAGCAQADDAETMFHEIREGHKLATAVGVQLDRLGALYKEQRLGRDDDTYREAIKVRASLAVNGTPEQILGFLRFSLGMADAVYYPEYPAGFVIFTDSPASSGSGWILDAISPAGVQGVFGSAMLDALGQPMLDALGEPMYGATT